MRVMLPRSAVQFACILDLVLQEIGVTPIGSGTIGLQESHLVPFEPGSFEKRKKKKKRVRH